MFVQLDHMRDVDLLTTSVSFSVTITMVLSALVVIFVNTEETIEQGAEIMAQQYQVWKTNYGDTGADAISTGKAIALSLANSFVMVTFLCLMTFVIVLLYRYQCMKCLIGYMILCSALLLGILGGNLYKVAIDIYSLPVDWISYILQLWNFAVVGVLAVFWSKGIPKYITQGYLILTSVILAWHLNYFDEYTTWCLLFMLALYDLCAVLTPCGPLKALVNLMSRDDAPEMPGLLFEAELPPEARRPGGGSKPRAGGNSGEGRVNRPPRYEDEMEQTSDRDEAMGAGDNRSDTRSTDSGTVVEIPLAIARVYNLSVLDIPPHSRAAFGMQEGRSGRPIRTPLLEEAERNVDNSGIPLDPTPTQLLADVIVRLPPRGGRLQKVNKNGNISFLERDRYGTPKRVLWVDRLGRVFAEQHDEDDAEGRNTIRLGLGDFIFYSVLVAKAAQYSFATFAACMLVILAGLGGTLVLLSVFHHALPALPISIFLGVFFYIVTRLFMEPWIEAVLLKPYYV
jgi:presenilin 1